MCFCSRIKFSLRRMICVDPTKVVCLWHWRECKSPARVQKPNARRDILFNSLPLPRPSFISYQRLVRVPFWFFTVACSAPTSSPPYPDQGDARYSRSGTPAPWQWTRQDKFPHKGYLLQRANVGLQLRPFRNAVASSTNPSPTLQLFLRLAYRLTNMYN